MITVQTVFVLAYGLIWIGGACNGLILIAILVSKKLRSASYVLIFNISFACLLYTLEMPLVVQTQIVGFGWTYGVPLCKMVYGVEVVSKHASILFVMMASVERFLMVVRPADAILPSLKTKHSIIATIFVWLFCIGSMIPFFFFVNVKTKVFDYFNTSSWMLDGKPITFMNISYVNLSLGDTESSQTTEFLNITHPQCMVDFPNLMFEYGVYFYVWIFLYMAPTAVMIYCYARIILKLRESNRRFLPPASLTLSVLPSSSIAERWRLLVFSRDTYTRNLQTRHTIDVNKSRRLQSETNLARPTEEAIQLAYHRSVRVTHKHSSSDIVVELKAEKSANLSTTRHFAAKLRNRNELSSSFSPIGTWRSRETQRCVEDHAKINRARRIVSRRNTAFKVATLRVKMIVTVFLVCWIPYWTINFISLAGFININSNQVLHMLGFMSHSLTYVFCAVNPILYGFLTDSFREAVVCCA